MAFITFSTTKIYNFPERLTDQILSFFLENLQITATLPSSFKKSQGFERHTQKRFLRRIILIDFFF